MPPSERKCRGCQQTFTPKIERGLFCKPKCRRDKWDAENPRVKAATKPTPKRRASQLRQARATRKWTQEAKAFLGDADLGALIEQHGDINSLLAQLP